MNQLLYFFRILTKQELASFRGFFSDLLFFIHFIFKLKDLNADHYSNYIRVNLPYLVQIIFLILRYVFSKKEIIKYIDN